MKQPSNQKAKSHPSFPSKGKKESGSKSRKTILIKALTVGVLGFLLYSNTLSHGYVLDDFSAIKENNIVRQGIHAIPEIFKTSYRQGYLSVKDGLYRPLSLAMFAVEWNFFPDKPGVSHFVNVVLYSVTGVLLFFMLRLLFLYPSSFGEKPSGHQEENKKSELVAFIASLLFIVHPLHVEVVANIKSRDELLCFLFAVCSFIAAFKYLKKRKITVLAAGMVCYFLSLLSKETSITFIALLPIALHFFSPATLKKKLSITAWFLGVAVIYLLIRHSVLQGAMADEGVSIADNIVAGAKTFSTRTGTAFYILGLYLILLFFPNTLSYDYSFSHLQLVSLGNVFSIASLLVYAGVTVYASFLLFIFFKKNTGAQTNNRTKAVIGFGILFFLITIFLFSNLVLTIGTSMGDRLMYFPSAGFCIVMAVLLTGIPALLPSGREEKNNFLPLGGTGTGLLAVIVLLYSFKTYRRNGDWKDNYTLYAHDVKLVPNSVKAHYYLGLELIKNVAESEQDPGKKKTLYKEGIRELEKSVEIMPAFGSSFTQMGVAYYRLKDFEKAIENYNKATALKQADAITLNNIGSVYFEWKKYAEASENFKKALQIDPRFVDAHMNLGSVYGTMGDFNNAIASFQNAIKYAPDNARAYYYIALTYQNMGDKTNADKYYQLAEQMDPKFRRSE